MRLAQPTCLVAAKPGLYCCSATVCPLAKSSRQHSGAKTRWVIDYRGYTENGGPFFWIHENYACPNCLEYPDSYYHYNGANM